ncbi:MAG: hypothetical protein JW915_18260 [Chitinispirillaceae bacterium]|nr:hypothetical protein [Chitinispirillaceae bacterium]
MNKLITTLSLITIISLFGCEKEKGSSQQLQKEPSKLTDTPNNLRNVERSESTDDKPVGKRESMDATTENSIEKYETELANVSTAELWKIYKESKIEADKAKEQGNYRQSIDLMLKGAEAAIKLERPGIAAWQYNNAAKHAIDYYKAETGYQERMQKGAQIKQVDENIAFKKETKSIMINKFTILEDAEKYLSAATKYNEMESDPKRISVIKSNMDFIKEMASIIE